MKIDLKKNTIVCGDNLEWLVSIPDNSIDLCYIDPPFFSNQDFEIIWGNGYELRSFTDRFSGGRAHYVEWMRDRVHVIHQKLKSTGSIFLHCDWHASHKLRSVLDDIFGENNFRNEIIWKRSSNTSSINGIYKRAHDAILFYSKSSTYTFNLQRMELSENSLKQYSHEDSRGKYQLVPLLVSGKRNGDTGKPWKGIDPNKRGKNGMHWVTLRKNLDQYEKDGLVYFSKNGVPRLKYYLEDNKGVACNDVWDDISLITSNSNEDLGYPTQKPEKLLQRIIQSASNEGDVVLDCFSGGGTTAKVAFDLNRKFIVGDVSPVAVKIMVERLYFDCVDVDFEIKNLPQTESELMKMNGHDFAETVCEVMGWKVNPRKSGDGGVDAWAGDKVPVQIKNHSKTAAGRPDLMKFYGALAKKKSKKGIFVAWKFSREAKGFIADMKREHKVEITPMECSEVFGGLLLDRSKGKEIEDLYLERRPKSWSLNAKAVSQKNVIDKAKKAKIKTSKGRKKKEANR